MIPPHYVMIGSCVIFVVYMAIMGALLGVITDRTNC